MRHVEARFAHVTENSIQVSIDTGADTFEYSVRASVPLFTDRSDALVPFPLFPAMRVKVPLAVPGPVSPKLLGNVGTAQDILASFSGGDLTPTRVVAEPAAMPSARQRGIGAFFSSGVDSFYTLMRHESELTHLIFVRGFDIFEPSTPRAVAAIASAREVAKAFGKKLIEIDTDLRDPEDVYMAHGATLATFGLLLQGTLGRVFIPSSYPYRELIPCGSHPLLDPLWSTEHLEIVHDGCEATRAEKIAVLASSDVALRELRVCNKQFTPYNCGRCAKCVVTMVGLEIAGALDRCSTLPDSIDLGQATRIELHPEFHVNWHGNLQAAQRAHDRRMTLLSAWMVRPRPLRALRHRVGRLRRALRARVRAPS